MKPWIFQALLKFAYFIPTLLPASSDKRAPLSVGRTHTEENFSMQHLSPELVQHSTMSPASRRLELAVPHVLENWFPANPQVLSHISSGFETGAYEDNRAALINDLKSDLALFTSTLSNLHKKYLSTPEAFAACTFGSNSLEILFNAPLRELRSLMSLREDSLSIHRLGEASASQAQRLKHAVITSTAAEVISETFALNPQTAFTTALFRQLGLLLISWNYPHIYGRVFESKTSQPQHFDVTLARLLGFSPTLLGLRVARHFGLPSEALIGLGDFGEAHEQEDQEQLLYIGERLEKICVIGETLAQLDDPEHYPNAEADWKALASEVKSFFGAAQVNQIQIRCEEALKSYGRNTPGLFKTVDLSKADETKPSKTDSASTCSNPYVAQCPPELRAQLESLYQSMKPNTVSKESIETLVREIIPAAGFLRGCIYMTDPSSQVLSPRLVIGDLSRSELDSIAINGSRSSNHMVAMALKSNTPIVNCTSEGQNDYLDFAAVLGEVQKTGVIYLQAPGNAQANNSLTFMICFKAVRHALEDCLQVF